MPTNPIMQYQEQAINTMSKGELLIKLYDEVLKNINYASILFKQKDYPMAEQYCDKSKSIFNYLSSILDRQYPVSADLYKIYFFMNSEIIRAQVKRDHTILDALLPLVEDMRATWAKAEKLCHMNKK
ncbi:MAG TPA: flagellar export chaperone FliS [Oscillospiraceae bacterium]|nr:flagellar export chaperone FliS [Oscillospiraceae bacterium]